MSNTYELVIPAVLLGRRATRGLSKNSRVLSAMRASLHRPAPGARRRPAAVGRQERTQGERGERSGGADVEGGLEVDGVRDRAERDRGDPAEADREPDRRGPDARPMCRGRYSWLITIVTPKVPITQAPTRASAAAPSEPADGEVHEDQRPGREDARDEHRPAAVPVGERAGGERPDPAERAASPPAAGCRTPPSCRGRPRTAART